MKELIFQAFDLFFQEDENVDYELKCYEKAKDITNYYDLFSFQVVSKTSKIEKEKRAGFEDKRYDVFYVYHVACVWKLKEKFQARTTAKKSEQANFETEQARKTSSSVLF